MRPERVATLAVCGVALDEETHLIQPGLVVPPLVCGSIAMLDPLADFLNPTREDVVGELLSKADVMAAFEAIALDPDRILEGANIAFDVAVTAQEFAKQGRDIMPAICAMYEVPHYSGTRPLIADGRVWDILIVQALDAVANGTLGEDPIAGGQMRNIETGKPTNRYNLANTHSYLTGRTDAKANDEWKLKYHELDGVPIEEYPRPAAEYPVDDGRNTHEDALCQAGVLPRQHEHEWVGGAVPQCGRCGTRMTFGVVQPCMVRRPMRNLNDLASQCRAAFAMALGASWGFRVNQARVDAVEKRVVDLRDACASDFERAGILKWKKEKGIAKLGVSTSALARMVAAGYQATGACAKCAGTGKTPSPKNPKSMINCDECAASGYDLTTAPTIPRTATGKISTADDVLEESGDETLMRFASDYNGEKKTIQTYIPYLRRARHPVTGVDIPLTLMPNVLLETGRTSYGGSIQQFPRAGGLRECIEARYGYVLGSMDYEMGELVTHAQNCIWHVGHSMMARALLANVKPHHALGATMIGLEYGEFVRRFDAKDVSCKDARQAAKPGNFGFPGGMGAAKLVLQQRKQGPDTPCPNGPVVLEPATATASEVRGYRGLRFCIYMDGAERCGTTKVTQWGKPGRERPCPPTCRACILAAVRLREHWLATWPENNQYFKIVQDYVENGQPHRGVRLAPGEIVQHVSERIRGQVEFTSGANGWFQALLADAAKSALWITQRECVDRSVRVPLMRHENSKSSKYAHGPSPLLGSRVIVFQHDELVPEMPRAVAHDAAMRASEIMIDELRAYCPDVADAAHVDPALMLQWFKGAEKTTDAAGRLVPWSPAVNAKCPTCGVGKLRACEGLGYGETHPARDPKRK